MAALFPTAAWIKDFVRPGLDVAEAGLPFRIQTGTKTGSDGRVPVFFVALSNHTKNKPLFVHRVRVHYGNQYCNHAFVLLPQTTVEIVPRAKREFCLSFRNAETEIPKILLRKSEPQFRQTDFPVIDSGVRLFEAIVNGKDRDSWIEIDFNEFAERRFRRGLVKKEFARILTLTLAARRRS